MERKYVWDPLVRVFHWSLAVAFIANAFLVDEESWVHIWMGTFIACLLILRIYWGFVGLRYARFASFPPDLHAARDQFRGMLVHRRDRHDGHSPLGALMVYNLFATLVVIIASGYLMEADAFWGAEWLEELHEIAVTWAEISVVLHIAAVFFESRRLDVNLPKAMITGYKEYRRK